MKYKDLKAHPIAEELPEMGETEYQELKDDILQNGLKERILLYEGKILDGRQRSRALKDLGLELDESNTDEFNPEEEGDPAKFVISLNIRRRHLTTGQRAGVALALLKRAGSTSTGKSGRRAKKGADADGNGDASAEYDEDEPEEMTVTEAAKAANVDERRVRELQEIERKDPKTAKEVGAGKKSLREGKQQASVTEIGDQHDKAIKRITKICGPEFAEQIKTGHVRMKALEVVEYANHEPKEMRKLQPLLEEQMTWKRAHIYLELEATPETRLRDCFALATMNDGKFEVEMEGYHTAVSKMPAK